MGPPREAAKDAAADEPQPEPEAAALPPAARVPEPAGWVVAPREAGKPAGGARRPARSEDRREEEAVSEERDR